MLRFVEIDLLQRKIIRFCCSRVIFSKVSLELPDMKLLFDDDFILNTLMKYKRVGGEQLDAIKAVCGKCEGYGYLDWVTKLRSKDGIYEKEVWGIREPIKPKNEKPIKTILVSRHSDYICVNYVSSYDEKNLEYLCDQCQGAGLTSTTNKTEKFTPKEFLAEFRYPTSRKIKKTKTGILDFLGSLISSGGKNDKNISDNPNRQEV